MPTNEAPPLTAEEIAELRDFLLYARGIVDFKVRETPPERFDRLVAERDALRAENAQLKSQVESAAKGTTQMRVQLGKLRDGGELSIDCTLGKLTTLDQVTGAISSLELQVEQLKADGERLDWLEAQAVGYGDGWTARMSRTGRGFRLHETRVRDGVVCSVTARLAIDLARKAKGE